MPGGRIDKVLAGELSCDQRYGQRRVQLGCIERIVVLAELLLDDRGGRHELIPGGRQRKAGFLEHRLVQVEDTARDRNRKPVQLAVHRPGRELFVLPLAQIDDVRILTQVGKAVAVLGKLEEPRPVDLHDVGLGAASQLRGDLLGMAVPAGELRLNGVTVLGAAGLDGLLRHLVAAVSAPPRHAQVGSGRCRWSAP